MKHVNKVTLMGNTGDVAKSIPTNGKTAMATVGLATNRYTKDGEDWKTHTSWHKLTFFEDKATRALETIKKGDTMYVEGELKYNTYDNKDGIRVTSAEVRVFDFIIIPAGSKTTTNDTYPVAKADVVAIDDDEVPF